MLREFLVATLSVILGLSYVQAVGQSRRVTAEVILTRFVEAVGDIQAYESIKTSVSEGELIDWDGQRTSFKAYWEFPDKYLMIEYRPQKEMRSGYDGHTQWRQEGTGKPKRYQVSYDANNDVGFRDVVHWRDKFKKTNFAGQADILSRRACVLNIVGSRPGTLYFDQQTGLLVRRDTRWEQSDVQIYYSHYVDTSGAKTPWRTEYVYSKWGQTHIHITEITKVTTNTPLDDAMFAMPTP